MLTIVYIILGAVLGLFAYICFNAADKYLKYPFQNWEKADLPYIVLDTRGRKLNMIIDSGSAMSIIKRGALKNIDHELTTRIVNVYALSREGAVESEVVSIPIIVNGNEINTDFLVYDGDDIGGFKKHGIAIDGLLGVEFFKATGGIVDFNTKTVKFP